MVNTRKTKTKAAERSRKRHSEECKREALAWVECIGVNAAAMEFNLHGLQL